MLNFIRSILKRKKVKKTVKKLYSGKQTINICEEAYYLSVGQMVIDDKSYFNWHEARRAAKKLGRGVFFQRGATIVSRLNRPKAVKF